MYKGVSLNGKKWQVMVMYNGQKYFSTCLASEKLAARVYDRYVIQSMGLKAKTNFSYTR